MNWRVVMLFIIERHELSEFKVCKIRCKYCKYQTMPVVIKDLRFDTHLTKWFKFQSLTQYTL